MKYILHTLTLLFLVGCVRSTAEWVVTKTEPTTPTQIEDSNVTDSSGVIFNEASSDSWYIVLCIGGLIFFICIIIPICARLDFSKITSYFGKNDT
jgi:hypothetical protein